MQCRLQCWSAAREDLAEPVPVALPVAEGEVASHRYQLLSLAREEAEAVAVVPP